MTSSLSVAVQLVCRFNTTGQQRATELAQRYGWGIGSNTHVERSNGMNHFVRSNPSKSNSVYDLEQPNQEQV